MGCRGLCHRIDRARCPAASGTLCDGPERVLCIQCRQGRRSYPRINPRSRSRQACPSVRWAWHGRVLRAAHRPCLVHAARARRLQRLPGERGPSRRRGPPSEGCRMMKETPRSFETRGRSDGRFRRQWRQMQEAYHGAGPQAKRSPKEPSAVPGTVISVSQVGFDRSGIITPPIGPEATARLRPARSWKAEGPTRPFGGAGRPMPSAQALSNQQYLTDLEVRDRHETRSS